MSINKKSDIATRVIHAGQEPDPTTGAVMMPVYLTLTYAQKSPRQHQGYEYSCNQNPMRFAYERYVADLESRQCGFTSASGMAATATILELLQTGDHVIVMNDVYGGSYRLFENVRNRSAELSSSFVDFTDENKVHAAVTAKQKCSGWSRPAILYYYY
ncbi:PLP-dependent transferase [Candidatus Coxiella mudrowiae]|uniref:PLP-dependent transferase n=1 Tax=Candidatus Coxiella mudrowiae TaxID=2054173 RepID=UPI000A901AD6